MLVEFGTLALLISCSMLLLFTRFPPKYKLFILKHPLKVDILVFILIYWSHAGTFSGGIIAALAAFFTSLMLTVGRKWYRIK